MPSWVPLPEEAGQHIPPHYAYSEPSTTVVPPTNRLAIVALVTGLCGLVLIAVGFAIAAFVQAGKRGERGKGLAVLALVSSAVWCVALVIALAVAAGSLLTADRDAAGHITDEDKVLPGALRVGDCFAGMPDKSMVTPVTALPCTKPHQGEVVGQARLHGDAYPGATEVHERSASACLLKTISSLRSRHTAHLEPYLVTPSKTSWNSGDRRVLCVVYYTGTNSLTTPIAMTQDPYNKYWSQLAYGDCYERWEVGNRVQRTVPCLESHWGQVYAVFTMKPGAYPGVNALKRRSDADCEKRLRAVFGRHPYPELFTSVSPDEFEWDGGVRTIVCVGMSEDRPLKKSMLPP